MLVPSANLLLRHCPHGMCRTCGSAMGQPGGVGFLCREPWVRIQCCAVRVVALWLKVLMKPGSCICLPVHKVVGGRA